MDFVKKNLLKDAEDGAKPATTNSMSNDRPNATPVCR